MTHYNDSDDYIYSQPQYVFSERVIVTMCECYPSTVKSSYLNSHPLRVVSRYHDPQLQVAENYSNVSNL